MPEAPTADRLRTGPLLVFVGVTAGFALVVFGAGSWAGTYYSNIRTASILAAVGGTLVWLLIALRRPSLQPSSQLTGGFAAALGAFAVSSLFAWNVRLAVDYLGYAVLLTALYLLLVRVWTVQGMALRLTVLMTVVCAGAGIAFLVATFATWMSFWDKLGGFWIPPLRLTYEGLWLGSPNAFAAFQVLVFATAAPGLLERGRRGAAIALFLGALVLVNVVLSASRGAWLGLAAAGLLTAIVWIASPGGRATVHRGVRAGLGRRPVVVALGLTATAILAAAVVIGPSVLARAGDLGGTDLRRSFIAASASMFQDRPLTGVGPGAWAPARLANTPETELDFYIPHAHNLPAQVVAEFGVVGIIAAVIVVVLMLRMLALAVRSQSARVRIAGYAALFACVYVVGQQLVDAFIHQPALLVAVALPIARLDALLTRSEPNAALPGAVRRRQVLTGVLAVAVVVGGAAAMWPERAAQLNEAAVAAADEGRWTEALEDSRSAVAADPRIAPYQLLLGLSAARAGDLETARDAFATAAALDDFPAAWINLAAVRARMGDDAGAREAVDRAVRLGRQQPAIAVPAAELYRDLGDAGAARSILAEAFTLLPSLASDPAWADLEWSEIASGALDDALAQARGWGAIRLALEAGRLERARAAIDDLAPADAAIAATLIDAWGGDQEAFGELLTRARANPLDAETVGFCRRIAMLHEADAAPEWTCDGQWWFGQYPVARVGEGTGSAAIPGPNAYPHALYAYRRPGPEVLLVPWLLSVYVPSI